MTDGMIERDRSLLPLPEIFVISAWQVTAGRALFFSFHRANLGPAEAMVNFAKNCTIIIVLVAYQQG